MTTPKPRATAAVMAAQRGHGPDPAERASRTRPRHTIGVLADPLLREGAAVAPMSFVGRLTDTIVHEAARARATAVFVDPAGPKPACDVWIVIDTGSGLVVPEIAAGVPVVATGVDPSIPADVTLLHDFDAVASDVCDGLLARGAGRIAVCAPTANATWVHRLTDGYRLWCRRHSMQPAVFNYAHEPSSARKAGRAAASRADAVFLISTRLQVEVVSAVRDAVPDMPMVVLGEGVHEAAYRPAVGILSLAPEQCAQTLVTAALKTVCGFAEPYGDSLPWRLAWPS